MGHEPKQNVISELVEPEKYLQNYSWYIVFRIVKFHSTIISIFHKNARTNSAEGRQNTSAWLFIIFYQFLFLLGHNLRASHIRTAIQYYLFLFLISRAAKRQKASFVMAIKRSTDGHLKLYSYTQMWIYRCTHVAPMDFAVGGPEIAGDAVIMIHTPFLFNIY